MFPCSPALLPLTLSTYYIDFTLLLLMSTSSLNPPALPTSPAVPPRLVLLSCLAPAPLTPALVGRWLIYAPGNRVLLLFSLQKQAKLQKSCPLSFLLKSKQRSNSSNKTQPSLPQTPSSSPAGSSHLQHVRCSALCRFLFLIFTALATQNTWGEELWTSQVTKDWACCEQPRLTHASWTTTWTPFPWELWRWKKWVALLSPA